MDAIIRNVLITANNITSSLQTSSIQLYRKSTSGTWGDTYAAPVTVSAIFEEKTKLVQTPSGQMAEAKSEITILSPIEIDYDDKIVGPRGQTGPILSIEGLTDPSTDRPYMVQVWLG